MCRWIRDLEFSQSFLRGTKRETESIFSRKGTMEIPRFHTMRADKLSLLASAAFLNSSMLMFPFESVPIATIFIPHMAALAGFVPCADTGIMHTLRWWSPLDYIRKLLASKSTQCIQDITFQSRLKQISNKNHDLLYHVICTNHHKPSIFSSSSSIGLQRERIKACYRAQHFTEILEHFLQEMKSCPKIL